MSTNVKQLALAAAATLTVALCSPARAEGPDLAGAQAIVDAHSKMPEFVSPGPPFDAKGCMQGKKLLSIPTSSSIPFLDGIETSMDSVAKQVGFGFQQWKNQGKPTQWVEGMEFGKNNGFTAIDLLGGIIPSSLAPQVEAAKAAGVHVFASHYSDTTQPRDPAAEVNLALPFNEVGRLIAAWIVTKTKGKANVLIIGSDDVLPSKPYAKTLEDTLDKLCGGGCKYSYVGVTVPQWSTKIQTAAQSALISDPTINYIVPLYDSMSQFVLPALTLTGRSDVKIATFNGTPFIIDMVRAGTVEMDVGESLGWIARSTLDGYMRKLCGLATYDTLGVPLFIFDKDNAATAGVPATFDKGYGDKHIDGYAKVWGLK